jgi:CelD/BcsL family acetyltransferase involved in cellulose biosynthesis
MSSQLVPVADVVRRARIVSPAPRAMWRELLRHDPYAVPTQTPEWTNWLCRTRGCSDASRLYEFPDGRSLLLPLLGRGRVGLRITEESMPYGLGYGGPLVPGGQPTEGEVSAILADLTRRPVLRAVLRPNPLTAAPWAAAAPPGTVQVPCLAHVLDLEGGFEQVWEKRYRPGARRDVRHGAKKGLDVREGLDSGVVEAFAELNRQAVERWAKQRNQPLWLARLVDRRRGRVGQLASAVTLLGPMLGAWSAWLDGQPVAVNVTVRFGGQVYGWLTAVDKEVANRTQAGALLQSLAIEDACRAGARWFHLGESDPRSGVATFKERFGARPVVYTALAFERLPLTAADRRLRAGLGRVTTLRSKHWSERP